jgi:hypothetical protein
MQMEQRDSGLLVLELLRLDPTTEKIPVEETRPIEDVLKLNAFLIINIEFFIIYPKRSAAYQVGETRRAPLPSWGRRICVGLLVGIP